MDELTKLVNDMLRKNINNAKLKEVKLEIEKSKAEELKSLIIKYTSSSTVKNSLYVEKNGNTYIVSFDNSAYLKSAFRFEPFNYGNYTPDAFFPIMINEGWHVKHHRWASYFGKGSKHAAENFIEKAVSEFVRKNKGITVTVEKTGSFIYRNGLSYSINDYYTYGASL